MIDKLAAFPELVKLIPREDRADPSALRQWLILASEFDPKGAQRPAYAEAHAALTAASAERDLSDQIARLYHDPKIRAEFGAERVEAAWRDPETAREELLALSAAGKLSKAGSAALDGLYAVRQYAIEQGTPLPEPAAAPLPSNPDDEIKALLAKPAL